MIELLTLLVAETLVPGFGVAIDLMKRGQRGMAGEDENIILLLQIPTASMDAPLSLSLSLSGCYQRRSASRWSGYFGSGRGGAILSSTRVIRLVVEWNYIP